MLVDCGIYHPQNNSLWRRLQFWGPVKREAGIEIGPCCINYTCKKCKAMLPPADRDL
jgi:hypothetical protein